MMGRAFLMAKRLEDKLNAERNNKVRVGRRLQFYRDDVINVLSFFNGQEAMLVEPVLKKVGVPERLRAYNTFVRIMDPDKFRENPLLRAIEYLDGKVNISISDALFNTYNQDEVIGFDRVTLDLDISNECISIDQAREWGGKVVNALKSLTGVEPIIIWSGCKGIHAVYFLNNIISIEYLAPLRQALIKYSGLEDMGLKLDPQTQEVKHVFRLPLTVNLKSGNRAELIHFTSFSNHVLSAEVAKTLTLLYDPLLGRRIVVTPPQVQVGVSKPLPDKVSQWTAFIKWLRDENIKLPDCRKRFAYLLGMYCNQVGITEDACEGLLNGLVSEVRSEHTRLLHYGYSKPDYLPSVYAFVRGSEWYSCNEVEELRNFRIPRLSTTQVEAEPSVPKPEIQPTEPKPLEAKPKVKPEAKPTRDSTGTLEIRPQVKPEPKEPRPEATATPASTSTASSTEPSSQVDTAKPQLVPHVGNNVRTPPPHVGTGTAGTRTRGGTQAGQGKQGRQSRLTKFIDKPTQPSIPTQSIEENWSKILRPEKRRVIDCKELGDECRFYEDWEELREWRSWSGEHIFEPPESELKDIITPQTHERLHKQLYELVINGKQQEALKLWDEFFNKVLARRMEERLRGG
jgi:hypothetical protein